MPLAARESKMVFRRVNGKCVGPEVPTICILNRGVCASFPSTVLPLQGPLSVKSGDFVRISNFLERLGNAEGEEISISYDSFDNYLLIS